LSSAEIFGIRKDPRLSCDVVCMILRLAVSVERWLTCDRQTHTHDYGIYSASMASRCKKIIGGHF